MYDYFSHIFFLPAAVKKEIGVTNEMRKLTWSQSDETEMDQEEKEDEDPQEMEEDGRLIIRCEYCQESFSSRDEAVLHTAKSQSHHCALYKGNTDKSKRGLKQNSPPPPTDSLTDSSTAAFPVSGMYYTNPFSSTMFKLSTTLMLCLYI
jgi:uncharacterized C2H2 Zn-finger protein